MKISASIELIWQLAGAEAVAGEFGDIQPEHFCMGLLKFSELSEKQADKVAGEGEARKVLVAEVQSLRDALTKSSIDTTRTRRALRAKLGKGGVRHAGENLHRSAGSRELFELAATVAADSGNDSLTALHLLAAIIKSPAPAIAQALRGVAVSPPGRIETPMLDKYGKDLVQIALQEESHTEVGRTAECKAILQVLASKKSVFLVANSKEAHRSTLTALARWLHAGDMSSPVADRRRVIEISWCPPCYADARPETLDQMYVEMLGEAACCSTVLLVCASSDMCAHADPRGAEDAAQASRLAQTQVLCIIPIKAREYEALVRADRNWKRLAEPVWVSEEGRKSVPKEL